MAAYKSLEWLFHFHDEQMSKNFHIHIFNYFLYKIRKTLLCILKDDIIAQLCYELMGNPLSKNIFLYIYIRWKSIYIYLGISFYLHRCDSKGIFSCHVCPFLYKHTLWSQQSSIFLNILRKMKMKLFNSSFKIGCWKQHCLTREMEEHIKIHFHQSYH